MTREDLFKLLHPDGLKWNIVDDSKSALNSISESDTKPIIPIGVPTVMVFDTSLMKEPWYMDPDIKFDIVEIKKNSS